MITIVVPYYNREKYLLRTLTSIAASTFRPISLILVDNGSTDGSRSVCESFSQAHETTDFSITLTEESKRGAAVARNKGLSLVTTDYVYFFDSDDEFSLDFLQIASSLACPPVDLLLFTTCMEVNGKTTVRQFLESNDVRAQILISHLNTQSMVFRTEALRKVQGWNEDAMIWNDWELGVRMLSQSVNIRWYTDRPFHTIHVHPDSLTGSDFSSKLTDCLRTLELTNSVIRSNRKARVALYYRHCILLGHLKREKNMKGCERCKEQMEKLFPNQSLLVRAMGKLICCHVAHHRPGGWKIAYWATKIFE